MTPVVIPAKGGTQRWVPAFAGDRQQGELQRQSTHLSGLGHAASGITRIRLRMIASGLSRAGTYRPAMHRLVGDPHGADMLPPDRCPCTGSELTKPSADEATRYPRAAGEEGPTGPGTVRPA